MRSDAITIDTNVYEHLFRTESGGMNHDGHVTGLLTKVFTQQRSLVFDESGRMEGEMCHRLDQYKSHREIGTFVNLLRGLFSLPRKKIDVNHAAGLMLCIDTCVPHGTEQSDKVIMFVACLGDTLLVSNNETHITNHARCLKGCADKHANTSPEFWNSRTANANL